VATVATGLPASRWYRRKVSEGTKRPIAYAFAQQRVTLCTGVGLRVYALSPRQVRLSLPDQMQGLPGTKGMPPTAAVLLTLFSPGMRGQCILDTTPVLHLYGIRPHYLLVCDALGIDRGWYEAPRHLENSASIA